MCLHLNNLTLTPQNRLSLEFVDSYAFEQTVSKKRKKDREKEGVGEVPIHTAWEPCKGRAAVQWVWFFFYTQSPVLTDVSDSTAKAVPSRLLRSKTKSAPRAQDIRENACFFHGQRCAFLPSPHTLYMIVFKSLNFSGPQCLLLQNVNKNAAFFTGFGSF